MCASKKTLRRAAQILLLCLWALLLGGCQEALWEQNGSNQAGESTGALTVHFIDVGQADCALLECEGQAMLIDGGNVADSSLVAAYLKAQGVEELACMVCTHAHEDHVGGLSGPLNTCVVDWVLAPVTQWDTTAFSNFVKYTQAQGLEVTVPEAGSSFSLGGATVTILGPRQVYENVNDTSIVLRVDYGETSFLFTGDMESTAEADLLDAGCDLEATVLKVGHHGSSTSTSYVFLRQVMPQYAVISCGEGNSYGHPHEEVTSRLYDAGVTVYRTDQQGTIVAVSDGESISFTTEKNLLPAYGRETVEAAGYIGNLRSHVFHLPTCANLPAEQNQILFSDAWAALAAGYTPCGSCKPLG